MSSKNAPKKNNLKHNQQRTLNREQAREQARALQEKEKAKRKRTRIIAACAGAILIVAVIVLAIVFVKNSGTDTPSVTSSDGLKHAEKVITMQTPANITEYGGISLGKELKAGTANTGVPQVDIYFDYKCHHCSDLGAEYGAALSEAAKAGDITLVYHPVAIMGDLFCYTGAAAEFFVAENEPDKYFAFHELMHEKLMADAAYNRIPTPTAQQIVDVAKEAGVSDDNCRALLQELTTMEDVLTGSTNDSLPPLSAWVDETTQQFIADSQLYRTDGKYGTPSLYIDGVKSDSWTTDIPELLNK